MRVRVFGWLLVLALASPVAATAAEREYCVAVGAGASSCRGLLWRIEPPDGARPSHLFGTIHLDDPRVTILPPAVRAAFDAADSLTSEMFANGPGLVHMAEAMHFTDGRTLESLLGPQWYARVRAAVEANGLPATGLERRKPWAVFFLLSAPRPRAGLPLDLKLQTEALFADKRLYALETMAEQIAVFDGMTLADQVELLKAALAERDQRHDRLEGLVRAYLARDLGALMRTARAHSPGDERLQRVLLDRLLDTRNRIMAERMISRLKEGNAFVAVGAGHLPGPAGILALLHARGYRLTPIY